MSDTLDMIVDHLRTARRLLFITGAGISAESGLPTYRGIGGLYNDNALTDEQIPIETALSGDMLYRAPQITWKYIHQIEQACRGATHNLAHRLIAQMERHFAGVCVLTQNIDGFHRAAGSRNVIEIHGDIHELHCVSCHYETSVADYQGLQIPPSCPLCGDLVRPRVVLFGEALPVEALTRLYDELAQGFDLIFSIGTTSTFPYIAGPVLQARQQGIPTVEINPADTAISHRVDYKLAQGAVACLDALWRRYQQST